MPLLILYFMNNLYIRVPCQRYIRGDCLYKHCSINKQMTKSVLPATRRSFVQIYGYTCLYYICFRGNSASNLSIQTTLKRDLSVWCDASMIFLKSFFHVNVTISASNFQLQIHLGLSVCFSEPLNIPKPVLRLCSTVFHV